MPTAAFNAIGTPNTNTVPFKWTCPHCKQVAEITHGDFANNAWTIDLAKLRPHDCRIVEGVAIACPNPDCRQPTIIIMFSAAYRSQPFATKVRSLRVVLLEPSAPQPLPKQVPAPIRKDFDEAWQIADISPKAAATLARRALQAMIRDFWKIKERTLMFEIERLREKEIDSSTADAIDAARRIGNVGAHLDIDADRIVDVEPNEAKVLIWLVEELAEDWYVRILEKRKRLEELKSIADAKE